MTTAEDLSFVREIAEEGRLRPLQGGPYLTLWGTVTSVGLAQTWAIVSGALALSPIFIGVFWVLLVAIGIAGTIYFGRRDAACADSLTLASKVERQVWQTGGLFIGLFAAMIYVLVATAGPRLAAAGMDVNLLFMLISPVSFGVYAIALATTAVAGRAGWLWPFVGIAFAVAAGTMLLIANLAQFGAAIAGVIAVVIAPGLMMIHKNRKAA